MSNETKFTAGPWSPDITRYKAGKNDDWIDACWSVGSCGFSIVTEVNAGPTLDMNLGQMGETNKANAHLIAAAPEMYVMLESLANGEGLQPGGTIEKLLAKARGNNNA